MHSVPDLPESFPHAVRVMAFFSEGQRAPGKHWTFEYLIFIQANASSAATNRALSVLRSVRDDSEALRKLGTHVKPSLYAVVGAGCVDLPDGAAVPFEHPIIINYLALEEQEVAAVKTHAEVRFPVRPIYFEE